MNEHPLPKVVMPNSPPLQLLKGQKALVTGANSGIGMAVALSLAQSGADVVINYFAGDKEADEVVQQIQSFGVSSYAHKGDVSKEEDVINMFETMKKKWGTIDILVNNAGITRDGQLKKMTKL